MPLFTKNKTTIYMKIILSFFLMFICLFSGYSQKGYPEPAKTPARLFYIQHSDNHNTYVYDANIKAGIIDSSQPINSYRIVYTQNGIKKPLSSIQKKLAYGMILVDTKRNLFKLRLASKKKIFFYLDYDESEKAKIYVTVNKHKMYLDKMFIQLKNGILGINLGFEYVLFYGKDFYSGKPVIEKYEQK